jgi:uroporphyrinogen-III synthase
MRLGSVLITRADDELDAFRDALAPHGLTVIPFPVLREVAVDDGAAWSAAVELLPALHRLAFTSPRAPSALRRAAEPHGLSGALAAIPAAAVGEATARGAASAGFAVAEVGTGGGADLGRLIARGCRRGSLVLHACAREHHEELAAVLEACDVRVISVVVYGMDAAPPAELPALPEPAALAAVVLTSPRAAEAYLAACGTRLKGIPHLAMGPTTGARARELGIDVLPLRRPTPAAIVEELCRT